MFVSVFFAIDVFALSNSALCSMYCSIDSVSSMSGFVFEFSLTLLVFRPSFDFFAIRLSFRYLFSFSGLLSISSRSHSDISMGFIFVVGY